MSDLRHRAGRLQFRVGILRLAYLVARGCSQELDAAHADKFQRATYWPDASEPS